MRKQINSGTVKSSPTSGPGQQHSDHKNYQAVSSNNSSNSSKNNNNHASSNSNLNLKMAHPAVILHQEMQRQAVQQQSRKSLGRTNTNQSSSLSHSEGKSSSSRSGNNEGSAVHTPSKKQKRASRKIENGTKYGGIAAGSSSGGTPFKPASHIIASPKTISHAALQIITQSSDVQHKGLTVQSSKALIQNSKLKGAKSGTATGMSHNTNTRALIDTSPIPTPIIGNAESRMSKKNRGAGGPPTIVFNLDTKTLRASVSGKAELVGANSDQVMNHVARKEYSSPEPPHSLGYKSFISQINEFIVHLYINYCIQMAASTTVQPPIPPPPQLYDPKLTEEEQKLADAAIESLRLEYLNMTLDHVDPKQVPTPQNQPTITNRSPTGLSRGLKPAVSPPGEKIVIKKSEIKFSTSPSNSPQPSTSAAIIMSGKRSPTNGLPKKLETKSIKSKDIKHSNEPETPNNKKEEEKVMQNNPGGRQQAFDFIKRMLSDPKGNTKFMKDSQKLLISGQTSPYQHQNHHQQQRPRDQKSSINFVHDMKKHGIDKDIDSVRAMRQFLESNSPQSVSPTMMMPIIKQAIQKQESRDQRNDKIKERSLKIKTSFKVEDHELGIQGASLGSGKSESSPYLFPFHRRSRSLSPPPEDGQLGSMSSQNTDLNQEKPYGDLITVEVQGPSNYKTNDSAFPRASQRAQLQLPQQKSYTRITPGANGGPVIPPDREKMESVIKAACGSPGGIFFNGKDNSSGYNCFSLKKHAKGKQKKANSQRLREQEEIERRILNGTEVEEWLESPQRHQTAQIVVAYTDEEQKNVLTAQSPRQNTLYHFSKLGFTGDTDELDEDDIELDMAGNDDWMFQTFQKAVGVTEPKSERKNSKENPDENNLHDISIPSPESIRVLDQVPQNLLSSLDIDNNVRVIEDDEEEKSQQSDEVIEGESEAEGDEGAIPSENMGLIASLLSDYALDFAR